MYHNLLILSSLLGSASAFARIGRASTILRSGTRLSSSTAAASVTETLASKYDDQVSFAKYQGLGNDFILIDDRDKKEPSLTPAQAQALCDRNFGIGGDGVIFALQSDKEDHDFQMRIYNSDGSEPEMCGNGIRCYAAFLRDLGETAPSYRIDTMAGTIIPVFEGDDICVDMGEPILDGPSVPTTLEPNFEANSVVEQAMKLSNGKEYKVSAVSMGNPHAIVFVDDLEAIPLNVDGPAMETAPEFPQKTNVEFVQVMSTVNSGDENHLRMKVWERGAGPTLACGTGTCALVVAAIRAGKIPRASTRVTLPGGDLVIDWDEETNKVFMTGPATFAFAGRAQV